MSKETRELMSQYLKKGGAKDELEKLITKAQYEAAKRGVDRDEPLDFLIGVVSGKYKNRMRLVATLEMLKYRVLYEINQRMESRKK
jgi:hypothetical protein